MPVAVELRGALIVVALRGEVGAEDMAEAAASIDALERETPGYDRLFLTAEVTGFRITFPVISSFAETRRKKKFARQIQTAIVVDADVSYGFARMYQGILEHPQVTVEIFRDREAALAWLGVTDIGDTASVGS
jgi:SpoIIAA-like